MAKPPTGPPTIEAPKPRPQTRQQRPAAEVSGNGDFRVSSGITRKAHKITIYGPGGIGKTTLAHLIGSQASNPLILDLERGSLDLDCERIDGIDSWEALRAVLRDGQIWQNREALILDSASRAEELASGWVVANVPHEKQGVAINCIEDFGWGKGFSHIYDQFLLLLGDLDRHVEADRHVVIVAHDCISGVPNPAGEDWIRYEPRLQSPASGKNSVRLRLKEWTDHLLFLGWDVAVNSEGKGTGAGTRTIYPMELPTHLAKSRTLSEPIPFSSATDSTLWEQLLRQKCN